MNKLLFIFVLMLVACGPSAEEIAVREAEKQAKREANNTSDFTAKLIIPSINMHSGISVVTIDSCEYIYCDYGGVAITHKENCTNPIHIK